MRFNLDSMRFTKLVPSFQYPIKLVLCQINFRNFFYWDPKKVSLIEFLRAKQDVSDVFRNDKEQIQFFREPKEHF